MSKRPTQLMPPRGPEADEVFGTINALTDSLKEAVAIRVDAQKDLPVSERTAFGDPRFLEALNMPMFTPEQQKLRNRRMQAIQAEYKEENIPERKHTKLLFSFDQRIFKEFRAWEKAGSFALQRCEISRLSDLRAAIASGNVDVAEENEDVREAQLYAWRNLIKKPLAPSFLIQNDWASPFKGAEDYDAGELRLPFDECFFEFKISGRDVIAHVKQVHGIELFGILQHVGDNKWIASDLVWNGATQLSPVAAIVSDQVKAACIAMDADIVEREIVRVPVSENRARAKRGQPTLRDHYVLRLSGRHRSLPEAESGGQIHRSPRLHFRRGHWRHYPNHKTWIKWQLVGNPDLGFIDKTYRL